MKMFKIEKSIDYYLKGKITSHEKTETFTTNTLEQAKEIIKNTQLNYVKNKNGVSAFESINCFVYLGKGQFTNYFKTRHYNTLEEWGNF